MELPVFHLQLMINLFSLVIYSHALDLCNNGLQTQAKEISNKKDPRAKQNKEERVRKKGKDLP